MSRERGRVGVAAMGVWAARAVWAVRLAVAGVFLYAGGVKALDPAAFARDIAGYRMLPDALVIATAFYLPWLEVVAAAALLIPRGPRFRRIAGLGRAAAVVLAILMLAFIAALAQAWARGLDITCGCFGHEDGTLPNYPWLLGRDVVVLACVAVFLWRDRGCSSDPRRH